jgi:prepilin-type processing-associated H-X9-DG protein
MEKRSMSGEQKTKPQKNELTEEECDGVSGGTIALHPGGANVLLGDGWVTPPAEKALPKLLESAVKGKV